MVLAYLTEVVRVIAPLCSSPTAFHEDIVCQEILLRLSPTELPLGLLLKSAGADLDGRCAAPVTRWVSKQ